MTKPLWEPSAVRIESANITAFARSLGEEWGVRLDGYDALWRFSVEEKEKFWRTVWREGGVIAETQGEIVIADPDKLPGAQFFPDARLNFAQNLLRRRDDATAIVFRGEDKVNRRLSYAELYDMVSRLATVLRAAGVGPGDRVAGYLPNMPETIMAMLAAASLGAVWSSCSPDFGTQGVLDRFGQIEPKVLFGVEGYHYNGKAHDCLGKLGEIAAALPSLERVVIVPYTREAPDIGGVAKAVMLDDFVAGFDAGEIDFVQMPFNAPLYILFSSGTTGVPKCIIHGAGGILLKHLTEHRLHSDVKRDDRVFYFTTCGWMMWNWLASALACEATVLLYDGSPFHPDGNVLFNFAQDEGATLFGTSAKFIDAAKNAGIAPIETHDLSTVRSLLSTGSPLVPESFDYVYERIKADIHLASISGGTDICGCFVLGNPAGPVWRGEIQARALGLAVDVFDDGGRPVRGEKGELVCTNAFPSMPVGFWADPDGAKYRAAYFERFPNVWCHGDYVALTEHDGMVIYGRSDATLNPGGVRIGTAEIYRQVEGMDEVLEGLVIGQEWQGDTRVVLFVVLRDGIALDEALADRIKQQIRKNTTLRHVPACIVQVPDIPRTKSNKIVELAVREIVHGRPIKNKEALANPEALAHFADRPELQS
ncbi:MAG: acetoacetate--CoA ligase [Rhodospirillaceae bacterium]|nr:acetoacetate--CoA ligase [Rhodospirillaceae bacterium]MBT6117585.1 acetoacetate--CoA ligase [Rhodospirillaceae bacterium]